MFNATTDTKITNLEELEAHVTTYIYTFEVYKMSN